MQKIAVIGSGYVGLVTSSGLARYGNDVICLDIDKEKISRLRRGDIPIYEPGLSERIKEQAAAGRLSFTSDYSDAVMHSDLIFLCVGTPPAEDKSADLSSVFAAVSSIVSAAKGAEGRSKDGKKKVIITKSTVPPGTGDRIEDIAGDLFEVVSNPEFLQEGKAIKNFDNPDRIIIGADTSAAKDAMLRLYRPFIRTGLPVFVFRRIDAEIIKYAANSMLAMRISFMNQLSHLCDAAGADITNIAKGIGSDRRIGRYFLHAGAGYGGSCFPKDIRALISYMKGFGLETDLLQAVDDVNERQKTALIKKIKGMISIKDPVIAVLGLSFKPNTDDIRESPALAIIPKIREMGAKIRVYDPEAMENTKEAIGSYVTYCKSQYDAIDKADAAVIMTEWDEFRGLDLKKAKDIMRSPNIIDGRNIIDPVEARACGISYAGIGR